MKKVLLPFLVFITSLGYSQTSEIFKNNKDKWGCKNEAGKTIVKAKYDSIAINDRYNSVECYMHNVLAAITDSTGKYLFKPKTNIIKNSNALIKYFINPNGSIYTSTDKENNTLFFKDDDRYSSISEEIENTVFLYLSNAVIDTITLKELIITNENEIQLRENGYVSPENIWFKAYDLLNIKRGEISIVNGKSELLNKESFDNIAFNIFTFDIKDIDDGRYVFLEHYHKIKNDSLNIISEFDELYDFYNVMVEDYGAYYPPSLPQITQDNFFFNKDNKWGIFSFEHGVVLEPLYDDFRLGYKSNIIEFFNHNVLAAIVDRDGNYLFKADEEIVKNSNAYLPYFFNPNNGPTTIYGPDKDTWSFSRLLSSQSETDNPGYNEDAFTSYKEQLDNSIYMYIANAVLDTIPIVRIDTMAEYYDFPSSDFIQIYIANQLIQVQKGDISLIGGNSTVINNEPYTNLAFKSYIMHDRDYLNQDEIKYSTDYYKINDSTLYPLNKNYPNRAEIMENAVEGYNQNSEIKYSYENYPTIPHIIKEVYLFEQKNKWGAYSFDKGEITPAIYDSYKYEDDTVYFYNKNVKTAKIDASGNYIIIINE